MSWVNVLGECRSCDDDTPMLDDEGNDKKKCTRKALEVSLSSFVPSPARRRRLKNTAFCFRDKKTIADQSVKTRKAQEDFGFSLLFVLTGRYETAAPLLISSMS